MCRCCVVSNIFLIGLSISIHPFVMSTNQHNVKVSFSRSYVVHFIKIAYEMITTTNQSFATMGTVLFETRTAKYGYGYILYINNCLLIVVTLMKYKFVIVRDT